VLGFNKTEEGNTLGGNATNIYELKNLMNMTAFVIWPSTYLREVMANSKGQLCQNFAFVDQWFLR